MSDYIIVIYTGGDSGARYYNGYGYECDLTNPTSCVMFLTELQTYQIILDHPDLFTVRSGYPWLSNGATLAGEIPS